MAQFWRGQMSLRELRVLVTHLPPDCATARRMRGTHWTEVEYLLADVLDILKFHRVEWAMAHGAKPSKPKPTPRPKTTSAGSEPTSRELARVVHQYVIDQVLPPRTTIPEGGE